MEPGEEIRITSAAEGGGRVPLTKREREILGLLAEGLSGAQIAGELVLSPETVRTHVRNAMAKLGA
jgi:DNA-binding CsgD family transcriptional regulator